jgi:thiol:disulfide interchange protein
VNFNSGKIASYISQVTRMKTIIRVSLVASLLAAALAPLTIQPSGPGAARAQAPEAATLVWQKDLGAALKTAAATHKWVLVDVYTDWCGWCQKLDTDVYTNARVLKMLKKSFIPVKVNAEAGSLGKYVAKQYDVHGYPTIVVVSPNGKMKGKISGYKDPDAFVEEILKITRSDS